MITGDFDPDIVMYEAVHLATSRRYVGVTRKGLPHRRARHLSDAKHGSKLKFHCALRKYGAGAFEFRIMGIFPTFADALEAERTEVEKSRPEFNTAPGGAAAFRGRKHSEKAKQRLREASTGSPGYWTGKKRYPETIEKMRRAALDNPCRYWLGKKRDPKLMARIQAAARDRCVSNEERQKRSEAMRLAWQGRVRKVVEMSSGDVFHSVESAARNFGISINSVRHSIYRNKPSYDGFSFAYAEDVS